MAAPASKTLKDINGKWLLNKELSDNPEPGLALQGIGWLTRKAIGMATVTLHIKHYQGPPTPPSTATEPVTHVDAVQTVTGGLKGTTENRCVDGMVRDHTDYIFGTVKSRSHWASPAKIAEINKNPHLLANWIEDESEKSGPEGETHIISVAESTTNGWVGTQTWGFQMIGGERRYCRNILIEKNGEKVELRLVYDWQGEETDA